MHIGRGIRILRTIANLSQENLAHDADICPGHLSMIENDLHDPSDTKIAHVARALKTNSELLRFVSADLKTTPTGWLFDNMARELALYVLNRAESIQEIVE